MVSQNTRSHTHHVTHQRVEFEPSKDKTVIGDELSAEHKRKTSFKETKRRTFGFFFYCGKLITIENIYKYLYRSVWESCKSDEGYINIMNKSTSDYVGAITH